MSPGNRKRLSFAVQTAVALALVAAVARYFAKILSDSQFDPSRLTYRFDLLAAAGVLYLLAHGCWAAFWVRLLHGQGLPVSWYAGVRAYFVSQPGKYVPGKVVVVLLRMAVLRHHGGQHLPVAVTAVYETLTSMAAGALLGVLLLPYLGVLPVELSGRAAALVAVAALPVVLGVLNKLAARAAAKRRGPGARPLPAPSVLLLAQGLLHGAAGHCLLGLSLGLTVAALVPDAPGVADTYRADLGASALSYVAGFLAFMLPGGIGARELVLGTALTPRFVPTVGAEAAAGLAVVVALVLRLVWTAAEVLLAGVLYLFPPRGPVPGGDGVVGDDRTERPPPTTPPPHHHHHLAAMPPDAHSDPGLVSLVIPVFNERDSLPVLYAEIADVARGLDARVEVVFVDDGSTDGSWDMVRELAAADDRVRGIRFRRNFGKAAALQAGFGAARGAVVMTLDADLQDDPHEIPAFLAAIRGGLDVVSGWKKVRLDPWHKTIPSRVFNRLLGWVTRVHLHDHNCGFKAYRAEVLREVDLYGELHRFVPVLAAARGFKVGELPVHHRKRKFGRSKYGWERFVRGFLDLGTVNFLTRFGRRPQHLLGRYGLLAAGVGFLGFFALAVNLVVQLFAPSTGFGELTQIYVLVTSLALVLAAAQFLFTGLLAELVVARKMTEQEPFSVAERTPAKGRATDGHG